MRNNAYYRRHRKKQNLTYVIMIIPVMIGYSIFFLLPVFSSFYHSLTDWNKYSQEFDFVWFANYIRLFTDEEILIGIKNSFIFASGMFVFQNVGGIALAVTLDRKLKTRNLLRATFFAPAVLSTLIVGYLWSFLMSSADYSLFNQVLGYIGIKPINWLGEPKLAIFSVILTQLWQWTGWSMVIYIANLQAIPNELYEAAKIDGASSWQRFKSVTLPLLNPAATVCAVTTLVGSLKVFDIIFSLTEGGPGFATETILTVMIKRGFTEGEFGYASAFGIFFLIIVMTLTLILMKFLNKWKESIS